MIQDGVDPVTVRRALAEVLTREQIPTPPREPTALEQWFSDLFTAVFGAGDGSGLARFLTLGSIAFLIVLVVAFVGPGLVRRFSRGARRGLASSVDRQARRARARELFAQAREAESSGDLVLALRLDLFALLVALGEEGTLDFRPGWTDRELLDRGAPPRQVRARLAPLLDELEPKTFGHVPAEASDLRRMESLMRELAPEVAS